MLTALNAGHDRRCLVAVVHVLYIDRTVRLPKFHEEVKSVSSGYGNTCTGYQHVVPVGLSEGYMLHCTRAGRLVQPDSFQY